MKNNDWRGSKSENRAKKSSGENLQKLQSTRAHNLLKAKHGHKYIDLGVQDKCISK